MRLMDFNQTHAVRPRRLASYLLRRCGRPRAAVPVDRLGSLCFGPMDKPDQLALKGFVAGQEPSGYGRPVERPDRERTDPPG